MKKKMRRSSMSMDAKGDLRITGWSINITWSNGKEEVLLDMPDDVASTIDEWLMELEEEVE